MLRLELLKEGRVSSIYVLYKGDRCEVRDYIAGLEVRFRKRLDVVLRRIAETGWAGVEGQVVKHLKGTRVACEIKEHGSKTRLFCFFHGRRMVVCTHGGPKPGRRGYAAHIHKVEVLYRECLESGVLG